MFNVSELFHHNSTNAKYCRLENLYKMLLNHQRIIAQAMYIIFFLKSDCPLMRYRKSPLDVRREYVKIQKSILRPLLKGKKLVFVSKYMFLVIENLNLWFN